jgi:hypothetical protein
LNPQITASRKVISEKLCFKLALYLISGDQNHGSPMMQQNIRSQTPGMNPVPNSQQGMPGPGMGQPRMVGPQGNVSQM